MAILLGKQFQDVTPDTGAETYREGLQRPADRRAASGRGLRIGHRPNPHLERVWRRPRLFQKCASIVYREGLWFLPQF